MLSRSRADGRRRSRPGTRRWKQGYSCLVSRAWQPDPSLIKYDYEPLVDPYGGFSPIPKRRTERQTIYIASQRKKSKHPTTFSDALGQINTTLPGVTSIRCNGGVVKIFCNSNQTWDDEDISYTCHSPIHYKILETIVSILTQLF